MAEISADAPDAPSVIPLDTVMDSPVVIHNELLCFLQDKSSVMTFDHLVKVVADFYNRDEVVAARQLLEQHVPSGTRLSRRQGSTALRVTVEDMLKVILNPQVKLPVFYATSMSKLPPVDVNHCDVSAILQELQALRAEVRAAAELREEFGAMSGELAKVRIEVEDLREQFLKSCSGGSAAQASGHFPPLSACSVSATDISHRSNPYDMLDTDVSTGSSSAAQRLKQAIQTGDIASQKKVKKKIVVGKSTNSKMQSVPTYRNVDLFISRVHPSLAVSIIKECVQDALTTCSAGDDDRCKNATIDCEKLPTKYDTYCSYHVTVTIDSVLFHGALSCLMSSEAWPMGMLVRRFFIKKNNGDDK